MATTGKKLIQSKTTLIVEKSGTELWGRVRIKGNLISDSAKSLEALKKQLKKLILGFENVEVTNFEVSYDLTSFFDQYKYLNVSEVAAAAGINPALMRQYAAGIKFPSENRLKEIENAIHEIGRKLTRIKLHKETMDH